MGERGRGDQPSAEKGWGGQPSGERGRGDQLSEEKGRRDQLSGERRKDQPSGERGRVDQPSGQRRKDQPSGERGRGDHPSGERGRGDQPSGERRGSRRGERERRERGRGPAGRQASVTTEDSVGTAAVDENHPQDQNRRDSSRRDKRRKDSKRDRGSRPSESRGGERPSREARDFGRPGRGRERNWGRDRHTKPSPTPDEKTEIKLDTGYGDLEEIESASDWEGQIETDQRKEEGEEEREAPESHNWASGWGRAQRKKDERQELSESLRDEHRGSVGRGRGRGGDQGRGRSGRPGSGANRQGDKSDSVQEIVDSPSTSWDRVPNRKGDGKPQPEKPSIPHKQQEFEKYDLNSTKIAIVDDMEGQQQVEEVEDTDEFVEVTSKKAQKEKVKKEREEQLKQELKEEKKNRRLATTKSSDQTTTAQLPSTAWTSKGETGEGPSPHANIWSTTPDWNMALRSAPGSAAPGSQLKESSSWPAMAVGGGMGVGVIGEGLAARPSATTLPSQTDHLTAATGNPSYSLFPTDPSLSSFISAGSYSGSAGSYGGSGGMLSAAVNLKLSQEPLSTSSGQPPSPGQVRTVDVEPVAQVQGAEGEQLVESSLLTSQENVESCSKGDEETGAPISHSKSSLPPRLHSTRANLSGGVGRGRGSIRGRKVERSKKGTESEGKDRDVPGESRKEGHRRPDREKVSVSLCGSAPVYCPSFSLATGHFQQILRSSS